MVAVLVWLYKLCCTYVQRIFYAMTKPDTLDWDEVRRAFPICKDYAYLNCGTFGPLLESAQKRLVAESRREVSEGRSNTAYYERIEQTKHRIRHNLASLIKSKPQEIALSTSTTGGCHIIINGLALGRDDEILTTDLEHHTFLTALHACAAKVRVLEISKVAPGDEAGAFAQASNDRTALIAASHVSWKNGRVLPIAEISTIGPPVLVDGAQSVGAIPIDMRRLGCDFLVFPGQKWLLGPDATGGVFIQERWHERLRIAMPSYYGHEPSSDFSPDRPHQGAVRFEPGPIALPMTAAWDDALNFADALWVPALSRAADLCAVFRERLAQRFDVITPAAHSTLLVFDPGGDADEANSLLAANKIIVRTVPGNNWLRLSVGFWNNEEDLNALLGVLT